MNGRRGLHQQILQLEGLDQIGVPDQGAVRDPHVSKRLVSPGELLHALLQRGARAEDRRIRLHGLLHLESDRRGGLGAFGLTQPIQARDGEIARIPGQRLVSGARLENLGAAMGRRPPEHDQIEQRIRAEPVRTVH